MDELEAHWALNQCDGSVRLQAMYLGTENIYIA